jgi:hypothetical protein
MIPAQTSPMSSFLGNGDMVVAGQVREREVTDVVVSGEGNANQKEANEMREIEKGAKQVGSDMNGLPFPRVFTIPKRDLQVRIGTVHIIN